ncbi:hypothetical protein LEY_69 [Paenibacillus phage Ley]|uniref:Uncharacterized protein n=3 Tax=Halcyonevirus C7Cdelta TaxID=2845733 RepID=A0A345ASM6_9CAUD|nr:hypothetical protein KMD17_gp69 [Paenibacillus phage C7Cdelta]AXF39830.1 hypothetical protein C7CDELTA_69 [Paenibacillus phage C7Cdelta]AXF39996.1 hypothetical protein ASH_69 [Paenibacillus phage Ash]AXF40283.1 hypothetical protein LEY_69 [Paenibacillus phage Ley]
MAKCWNCGVVEIPEPEYYCACPSNECECGCYGALVDPPFCEECWHKMMIQTGETDND